ncbi:MAG: hypothetical protein JWP59_135 [Massilia sp.]|nr:hypothetical protein [Massilia sp.]
MRYKTILVHAGSDPAADDRMRLAARLARDNDAHLVGSALSGISRFLPAAAMTAGGDLLAARCAALRHDAAAALARFERLALEAGIGSWEPRLIDDEAAAGMALQARYCDLVVVGQADRSQVVPSVPPDLPEYLFLSTGRPVLVVPCTGHSQGLDGNALVAWDGSVEATRAVSAALPLLRAARSVSVMAFDAEDADPAEGDACERLASYLRLQGVAVAGCSVHRPRPQNIGEALLSAASDMQATLLVTGGYGHSRLREVLTHGVTATILRAMTMPVLFAH